MCLYDTKYLNKNLLKIYVCKSTCFPLLERRLLSKYIQLLGYSRQWNALAIVDVCGGRNYLYMPCKKQEEGRISADIRML